MINIEDINLDQTNIQYAEDQLKEGCFNQMRSIKFSYCDLQKAADIIAYAKKHNVFIGNLNNNSDEYYINIKNEELLRLSVYLEGDCKYNELAHIVKDLIQEY